MDQDRWFLIENAIPALLVFTSVPLLALAVVARSSGGPAWTLFIAGVSLWGAGIAWSLIARRAGLRVAGS